MANEEHLSTLKNGVEAFNAWRAANPDVRLDLTLTDLSGADLSGANLAAANLRGTDLSSAKLRGAQLSEADLVDADLSGADLTGANLSVADLRKAKLTGANLSGVILFNTQFAEGDCGMKMREQAFTPVNAEGAILRHLDLWGRNLANANLRSANLEGAGLSIANLTDADLSGANLTRADFSRANLSGADLRGATLCSANFDRANLYNVRFNRFARYMGINVATCQSNPRFRRFAQDQEFIEEFRAAWWRKPIYAMWLVLADCGRSLSPWAAWSLLAVIGFAIRYYCLGPSSFEVRHLPWNPSTLIYYSVVTFTTLGFGDITPKTPEAAMWVMAEVIIGYVMLGGLISIFATKLARRS